MIYDYMIYNLLKNKEKLYIILLFNGFFHIIFILFHFTRFSYG